MPCSAVNARAGAGSVAAETGSRPLLWTDMLDPVHVVLLIGPPAVGKMTVGREICALTGYRLLHNHHTIEPLLEVFGYGTRAFNLLNQEFRRRIVEEAVTDELPGLVFAFKRDVAWARGHLRELDAQHRFVVEAADEVPWPVHVVENGAERRSQDTATEIITLLKLPRD